MQLAIMLLFILGAVFVYSAIKGKDPRDVIKGALRQGAR